MSLTDCRGVPVSSCCRKAIEGLEAAHEDFLRYDGDPLGKIEAVLAAHPDFVMGHVFKAGVLSQAMETRIYDEMCASLRAAEALADRANDRERGHIAAVRAWCNGDFYGAVQHWQAVLVEYPHDLLALQLAHLSDVLLGDVTDQRDVVARVFPDWDEGMPGYGYLLGIYSFGLEECRDFSRAEEYGRQALAMNPRDAYAIHAVAHVMEMRGRQQGGIWFMTSREKDWADGNFANHLWWHLSLFHLDLGQTDRVLEIYDRKLRSDDPTGDRYEELDSAALLWRLKLLDVDVGTRWSGLADKWAPSATDTLYAFNDVHAMITFVSDGRDDLAEEVLHANERYTRSANDANVAMTRTVGLPFCRAIQAFAKGDYDQAVELLLPIRYRTHLLGGSHAQRDIIAWTLLEAALRAGRHKLALSLANERTEQKPTSAQNWRMRARALDGLGAGAEAARTHAKVESLLVN